LAQAGALPVVATLLFACRPSVPEVSQQRPANQPAGAPKRPSPPTAEPGSTPPSKIGLAEAAQEEATPTPAPTDPPVGATPSLTPTPRTPMLAPTIEPAPGEPPHPPITADDPTDPVAADKAYEYAYWGRDRAAMDRLLCDDRALRDRVQRQMQALEEGAMLSRVVQFSLADVTFSEVERDGASATVAKDGAVLFLLEDGSTKQVPVRSTDHLRWDGASWRVCP
jgi:hypothetical protein